MCKQSCKAMGTGREDGQVVLRDRVEAVDANGHDQVTVCEQGRMPTHDMHRSGIQRGRTLRMAVKSNSEGGCSSMERSAAVLVSVSNTDGATWAAATRREVCFGEGDTDTGLLPSRRGDMPA